MYDRVDGVFKSDVFPEHVLPYTKSVRFIYEDKKKNLWFCDDKEGVVKVDESFTTFEHITINDFLPNNSVMSIVEDPKNGGLWFDYSEGVTIYKGRGKIIIRFFRYTMAFPDIFLILRYR